MFVGPEFYRYPLSILTFSLFRYCVSGLPVTGEYLFPVLYKRNCQCGLEYEQVTSVFLQLQAVSWGHLLILV